ncbi:hypothetical protein FHW20_002303 [Ochrobactrum intermedium]|uniref:Guanylate cyclase domain-containing protein n=1 Tax=Brucella intermedia TaxID=94625 RepID=A0ABR6API3_9HYPH|nr:hypothetical protein [Brucella intermedia]MBA8851368.1 hypothetical protein [Brucella intermedia]
MQKYERRLILFIDILGFKSMVNSSTVDTHKVEQLVSAVKSLRSLEMESSVFRSQRLSQFSDNVVLSFKYNTKGSTFWLIDQLTLVLIEMARKGILCRGAITVGDLLHTKDLVIGPGLVHAYELESQVSIYPRVIVDQVVLSNIVNNISESNNYKTEKRYIYDYLKIDGDGWHWVDYISYQSFVASGLEPEDYDEYREKLSELVENNINSKHPSVSTKYRWLEQKLK